MFKKLLIVASILTLLASSSVWAQEQVSPLPQLAATQSAVSAPTGIANTSGLMVGLAGTITPIRTGRVLIDISGNIANSTAADGAKVEIRTGTGGAPSNQGALTGTVQGTQQILTVEPTTSPTAVPFHLTALVTSLANGVAVWIDVDLATVVGGTASITNVNIVAHEI